MRKLASIVEIKDISSIEGADRIELAKVLGWQCVVNKNQFKVGDKAVYFEIDSFLPIDPKFEFLRGSSYKKSDLLGEGFRLKTMKFRGEISQGLLMPLKDMGIDDSIELGTDVTDKLGVKKWEIVARQTTGGTIIGTLPPQIPRTDETRVQAQPDLINEFAGLEYYISTKMDGSSHSVMIDKDGFKVTGHTYEYKDDGSSSFYELVKSMNLAEKMAKYVADKNIDTLVIQGEFCGRGIQKNRLKLVNPEWYVFTIRINDKRVGFNKMLEVCKDLKLTAVPIEEVGTDLPSKYPTVEALLERADGEYPNGGKKEGIVIRPTEPVYSKLIGSSLSMKVVNNKYLLKNKE